MLSGEVRDTGLLLCFSLDSVLSNKVSLGYTMVRLSLPSEWYWSEGVLESGEHAKSGRHTDPNIFSISDASTSDWVGSVLFPGYVCQYSVRCLVARTFYN